jgi:hypothetical protein
MVGRLSKLASLQTGHSIICSTAPQPQTHWKNNPFEVVRFMKGPQGHKPAERLFRKMINVSFKMSMYV